VRGVALEKGSGGAIAEPATRRAAGRRSRAAGRTDRARSNGATGGVRAVLTIRSFRRLWFALSLSSFGDWLGFLAQTSLAASLAHGNHYLEQNFSVGIVVFVRLLPAVTLAPLAGAFADRLDRRKTMVVADVTRFSLYASIPLVRTLWWLFIATFLIETMSLFWIPAKEATVPNLVGADRLEEANQLSLLTTYGSAPIAALVFSVLALVTGVLGRAVPFLATNRVDLALYFDAATFLVSAITIFGLREISRRPGSKPAAASAAEAGGRPVDGPAAVEVGPGMALPAEGPANPSSQQSVFRSIAEGWRFVGQTPVVRGLVIGLIGAFSAAGMVVGLAKIYVHDIGGGDPGYGALFGSVFVGLAGGMFLGPRLLRGLSRRRLFGASIVAAGAVLAVTAVVHNLVLAVLGVAVMGAFGGVAWVTGYTLLGLEVEDAKRGRTWATLQSMMKVDLLVMVAAGPFVSGAIGVHSFSISHVRLRENGSSFTLFGAGLLALAVGVLAYRQMDDRDVPLWRDLVAALRGWHPLTGRGVSTGLFIAFEGGEGAGKSTQVQLLREWLDSRGYEVVVTREPGATLLGRRLREVLLDPATGPLSPRAEALLYAADRAEHVAEVIRPALARGAVVVSDRYVDSSLAYQAGGRALSPRDVDQLSEFATSGLRPDLTVLLDLPVSDGMARAAARDGAPDRLEAEPTDFHERVRLAFRRLAEADPERYVVIDATLSSRDIHRAIVRQLEALVPALPASERLTVPLKIARR
jgi:dTMP kinase